MRMCDKKAMKTWVTRLLMCFAVAAGVLWGSSLTTFAAPGDLVIGGTSNDSDQNCSAQGWSYVASTHTLTLNGFNYNYTGNDAGRPDGGIEYKGTQALTITVNGTNSITGCWAGILSENADLSINGSGNLSIEAQSDDENYYTDGIRTDRDLTIQAATVIVNTDGFGLTCSNFVFESGKATITAGLDAVYPVTATINGGYIKAVGKANNGFQVVGQNAFVIINGGTVIAEGQNSANSMSSGIYCLDPGEGKGDVIISSGSTVIAAAGTNAADADEQLAIYGVVKNAVAGKGWMDYTGAGNGTAIAVNTTGAELTYKRVAFPADAVISTEVPVSSVTLNKTSLSLAKGASDTLTATVSPANATDKAVTWATSNAAVATVSAGKVTAVGAGKATITATAGGKSATCEVTVTATTDKSVGEKVTDKSSKAKYEVTSNDASAPTVAYKATTATSAKTISVPATVKINGKTYKVTSVAKNAFKGNKKVTKVTIGANVTSIGDGAFSGCSKLTTVTVAKNVDKLGSGVFSGCKKLKTLTIKSTKLTDKNVNKKAFKGITKKTTIKVPKSKLKDYKALFKKKGLAKNVKVKK